MEGAPRRAKNASAANCPAGHRPGWRFLFGGRQEKCLRHSVVHRPLLRNAVATALVVGSFLTLVNQGPALLSRSFPAQLYWKIPLTYLTPYFVSTWSALRTSVVRSEN